MTAKETITVGAQNDRLERKTPERAVLDFGQAWAYAPAPEAADHVRIAPRYELFIGGKWVAPQSGAYFDTISPSTEQKLAEVAEADERDVAAAVESARHAYEKYWSKLRPIDRGKYIYRIARVIQEKARELAIVESMDGGKPIKESRDVDVPLAAAHFFYYAGWADKLPYAFPGRNPRPLGVAGQVIPWNFPLLMAAWKLAPRGVALRLLDPGELGAALPQLRPVVDVAVEADEAGDGDRG